MLYYLLIYEVCYPQCFVIIRIVIINTIIIIARNCCKYFQQRDSLIPVFITGDLFCEVLSIFLPGHDTKAMLNSSGPRYKRSKLEKEINKDVIACVFILFILCLSGAVGKFPWFYCYMSIQEINVL